MDLTGVTEFHIVGGVHPDWGFDVYLDIVRELHREYPDIHIKLDRRRDRRLHPPERKERPAGPGGAARGGVGSLPGGGAEIFDWEIRRTICRTKCTGERWIEVHETAHDLGMKTNSTMLYGHIETPESKVDHMLRLRDLQERTGGFRTFIRSPSTRTTRA